jgi:hypothetical protein
MSDCRSNTKYLIEAAERSLSPRVARDAMNTLHWYGHNSPHDEGRKWQEDRWIEAWKYHSRNLIWC